MGGNMSLSFSVSLRVRFSFSRHSPHQTDPTAAVAAAGDSSQALRPPQLRELPVVVLPHKSSSSSTASPPLLGAASSSSDAGCPICLEQFAGGQEVRILPRCRHAYHRPCIDRWLLRSGLCPVCRDHPIHPGLASIIEAPTGGLPDQLQDPIL